MMTAARCFPNMGGVERHVESVRRELAQAGHLVDVVELGEGRRALRSLLHLCGLLRRKNYDVVHAHDFTPALVTYAAMVISRSRRRLYVTIHGYEGFPLRTVYVAAHRFVHRLAARIIAIGAYIDQWYGTRSNVVLHGGIDKIDSAAEPSLQAVTFVSRLAQDTNAVEIATAFAAVSHRRPDVKFKIYGFGDCTERVKGICAGTPVEYLGPIADVAPVLADATVIIANSYLAILEAFACGKPVVSYYGNPLKKDYLSEIAEASKAVMLAGTPEELQGTLSKLLVDRGLRAQMSERGLAYAERFRWRNVARDYLSVWASW